MTVHGNMGNVYSLEPEVFWAWRTEDAFYPHLPIEIMQELYPKGPRVLRSHDEMFPSPTTRQQYHLTTSSDPRPNFSIMTHSRHLSFSQFKKKDDRTSWFPGRGG